MRVVEVRSRLLSASSSRTSASSSSSLSLARDQCLLQGDSHNADKIVVRRNQRVGFFRRALHSIGASRSRFDTLGTTWKLQSDEPWELIKTNVATSLFVTIALT